MPNILGFIIALGIVVALFRNGGNPPTSGPHPLFGG